MEDNNRPMVEMPEHESHGIIVLIFVSKVMSQLFNMLCLG